MASATRQLSFVDDDDRARGSLDFLVPVGGAVSAGISKTSPFPVTAKISDYQTSPFRKYTHTHKIGITHVLTNKLRIKLQIITFNVIFYSLFGHFLGFLEKIVINSIPIENTNEKKG